MSEIWYTPEPTKATSTFWEGTSQEKLLIPYCPECDDYFFFPRSRCPSCLEKNIKHKESNGKATLASYTTIYRPPVKTLQEKAPYINALVDLDEGVRMMTNIEADHEDELEIGMPLEIIWKQTDSDIKIPYFTPR